MVNYTARVSDWPMMDNDKIGDCAIATVGHLIQLYTSYTKKTPIVMNDEEIIHMYSAVSGYNPNNPASDQGCVISSVLNYWINNGVQIGGYSDKISLLWFGGVYIGINMPLAWQSADSWTLPSNTHGNNAPGSWGGHAVPIVAYDHTGVTVITWGEKMVMTWDALAVYCDEAWAVISADFINQQGLTPANFDWTYLLAAMSHIRAGWDS
jgi:hypothetical protein